MKFIELRKSHLNLKKESFCPTSKE